MRVDPNDPLIHTALSAFIERMQSLGYPILFLHFEDHKGVGGTVYVPENAQDLSTVIRELSITAAVTTRRALSGTYNTQDGRRVQ